MHREGLEEDASGETWNGFEIRLSPAAETITLPLFSSVPPPLEHVSPKPDPVHQAASAPSRVDHTPANAPESGFLDHSSASPSDSLKQDADDADLREFTAGEEEAMARLIVEGILSTKMTREMFDSLGKLRDLGFDMPSTTFRSRYKVEAALREKSRISGKKIDCCHSGCVLFYGKRAKDQICALCNAHRYAQCGKVARRTFTYISPVPRLVAMFKNRSMADMLRYRTQREEHDDILGDVFDGSHYRDLKRTNVKWKGRQVLPGRKYFASNTDIALSLATDGIPLFKRKGVSVWPLILTVLSLPPQLRYRKENQICCGLVPTRLVDDDNLTVKFDSFLQPLIDDLKRLATSGTDITGWRNGQWESFKLKAHLIAVTGDMKAISRVMNFKGVNGLYPCRWCKLKSTMSSNKKTAYSVSTFPIGRRSGPRCLCHPELRTDKDIKMTSKEIRKAKTAALRKRLRLESGINGEARLYVVDSLDFPNSFPVDFMHLMFENIMKQLLSMWEGTFKAPHVTGETCGRLPDDFVIPADIWQDISRDITSSNKTVPTQIARVIGPIHLRSRWTADMYCYFLEYLGPIVLKDRLSHQYYEHFLRLSAITKEVMSIRILRSRMEGLRQKIESWVLDFETLYYRGRIEYIGMCTAPIHALLHLPSCIDFLGPPSYYWGYAMERYGGRVKAELASNKHPAQMLSNLAVKQEQIHQLLSKVSPERRQKILDWSEPSRNEISPLDPVDLEFKPYRFRDRVMFAASKKEIDALVNYFTVREYTDLNRHPVVHRRTVAEAMPSRAWSALDGGSEKANQTWRTADNGREKEARDTSWTMVEDKNKWVRLKNVPTIFSPPLQQWGRILRFLEVDWRNEHLQLAIIEPHVVQPWINIASYGDEEFRPMILGGRLALQVIEVGALGGVAGRVTIGTPSHSTTVIFETTLGVCKPNIVDTP